MEKVWLSFTIRLKRKIEKRVERDGHLKCNRGEIAGESTSAKKLLNRKD